jgi:hypothetical protein
MLGNRPVVHTNNENSPFNDKHHTQVYADGSVNNASKMTVADEGGDEIIATYVVDTSQLTTHECKA